jgi:hypothetical protein
MRLESGILAHQIELRQILLGSASVAVALEL